MDDWMDKAVAVGVAVVLTGLGVFTLAAAYVLVFR